MLFPLFFRPFLDQHDSNDPPQSAQRDKFGLGELETTRPNIKAGRKQIQAKIVSLLSNIDKAGAARIMNVWKTMLSRTLRDKTKDFANLEEYIEFRSIDTGGA